MNSPDDARQLLEKLGAPARLRRHVELVLEAAELLLSLFEKRQVKVDSCFVRLGVLVHDAGKILHPNELSEPGHQHERAGERLLIDAGVDPAIARCCVSHAAWQSDGLSLEELLVALSDHLWKGKRSPELEKKVIDTAATRAKKDFWDLFVDFDAAFESIAAGASDRLARS
ncbi:MAG: HD domain-containing protein [Polyangiaceae bacterium]